MCSRDDDPTQHDAPAVVIKRAGRYEISAPTPLAGELVVTRGFDEDDIVWEQWQDEPGPQQAWFVADLAVGETIAVGDPFATLRVTRLGDSDQALTAVAETPGPVTVAGPKSGGTTPAEVSAPPRAPESVRERGHVRRSTPTERNGGPA